MSKAVIYKGELEFIARCVIDYPDIETGGDLFGFWTHSGFPSIQYVIGPGNNSNRNSTAFYQDKEYLIEMGRRLREKYGLQHIGEWHSHHRLGLTEPSGGDRNTVRSAIERYGLNYFLLVICNIHQKGVSLNGYYFTSAKSDCTRAGWVILEGYSPLRKEFDSENKDLIYKPREKKVNFLADPITTLESRVAPEEEKLQFPKGSWMNTHEGKDRLKNISDDLRKNYKDIRIFQTDEGRIKLEVVANGRKFLIVFPHDFPSSRPDINIMEAQNNSNVKKLLSYLNEKIHWNEHEYKTYFSNYIMSFTNYIK